MLVDDIGGVDHGIARGDGAVGLDLEDEAVVVGVLPHAAGLDGLGATTHRGVQRVDVDDPDGIAVALVVVAGDVAATGADAHLHGEVRALAQGADDLILVHELELGGDLEVAAGDGAGAVD